MDIFVFFMVLASAFFHASWNLVTKKISGNIHVIWLSTLVSTIFMLPMVMYVGIPEDISFQVILTTFVSSFFLTAYLLFLAKVYKTGDISVVYPIFRGFAVVGTAIFASIFLDEHISFIGAIGIMSIALGIFLVGKKSSTNFFGTKIIIYSLLVGCTIVGYSVFGR